jgi:hypothetical protein
MKYNVIHDVQFSDSTSGGAGGNAISEVSYTAIGGETMIVITELIGKLPQFLFRDGIYYALTETDPPQGKKYTFDAASGTIVFSAQVPAMEPGELAVVHYVDTASIANDVEPVTLDEVKAFCGVDFTEFDNELDVIRTAARIQCEQYTGLSLIPKQVKCVLSNCAGYIEVPFGPVAGTPVVKDQDGGTVTASFQGNDFKRMAYPYDAYLTLEYTAGYSVLPSNFKMAILNQCKFMYDNRGVAEGSMSPLAVMMLKHFRRVP